MIGCPPIERLSEFLAGTCAAEESSRIEAHIADCPSCCDYCLKASSDEELLSAIREVLDSSAPTLIDPCVTTNPSAAVSGETDIGAIEGYTILRELGRGGMGVVYLAHQASTKREVALKVLLEGPFASTTAKRRFEREVELAAQLAHPNIVTILESGLARGRYYFAMQYVEGQRLDHFVACHRLGVPQVLRLFAKVCRAVSFAHQRGVIHRDLKPSNILVDDAGEPHVLDFGLAKQDAPDGKPAVSLPGQVLGTVPFMSPEQAVGAYQEVGTRSDVYSLGVILFRLLTGRMPYEVSKDVRRTVEAIVSTPPARPSRIRRDIDGDAETIVLRALAKERDRRYASADALVEDIESYLACRPIAARRDNLPYVLRKFISRHRFATASATVMLVLGFLALTMGLRQRATAIRAEVGAMLAALVRDFPAAQAQLAKAPGAARRALAESVGRYAQSAAYTERIAGARGAILLDSDAFWHSVDGGPLWAGGEWLELCALPRGMVNEILPQLTDRGQRGTDRQKYVAFCLIGQLVEPDEAVAALCTYAAAHEPDPGVAAAARWAAQRLGRQAGAAKGELTFHDDLSRLTFVRVPAWQGERSGPDPHDPDRFADEGLPAGPAVVESFFLAETEVTWAAFAGFLADPAGAAAYGDQARNWLTTALAAVPEAKRDLAAVGYVTLGAARRYAEWLSEHGATAQPRRRYRLPTEQEWEVACRAGGTGRFAYGDDARYLRYFANSEGAVGTWPIAAQRMPSAGGLFDMHGSLWEWTDTRYPSELVTEPLPAGQQLWVYRGGAYHSPAARCRCAQRNYGTGVATDYTGFRIVMEFSDP
ncbi:MAG: protein kinase [Planctomycetes bacterium]|nr:protein kinase [Planctomycetota bacterium]